MNKITRRPWVAPGGLVAGAVLGMLGTFTPSASVRGLLWGLDGVLLIVAAALLTIYHCRRGNDVIAAHSVLQRAIAKAREGGGPHVVEALTYRLHDHTTADDATRYRTDEDVERAKRLDPLARLKAYLMRERLWTEAQEAAAREACNARVEQAVAEFLAVPPRPPEAMFEHLFAELPAALHEQRDAVRGASHE